MRESLTEEEIVILRNYAKFNLKIQPVADQMHYHRRTIFKKLFDVYKKTGKNPHNFWELVGIIQQIDKEEENDREQQREVRS